MFHSRVCLLALCMAHCACSSLLPPDAQRPERQVSDRCRGLDRRFRWFGGLARVGGVGAVSSGLGSAATDDTPRVAFGASALTFGLLAATAGLLQSRTAAKYVETCTVNTGRP